MSYKITEAERKHIATIEDTVFTVSTSGEAGAPVSTIVFNDGEKGLLQKDVHLPVLRFQWDEVNSIIKIYDEENPNNFIECRGNSEEKGIGWKYKIKFGWSDDMPEGQNYIKNLQLINLNNNKKEQVLKISRFENITLKSLVVDTTTELTGALTVGEHSQFNSTVNVSGAATFNDYATFHNDVDIDENAKANIHGTLTVDKESTLNSLTVTTDADIENITTRNITIEESEDETGGALTVPTLTVYKSLTSTGIQSFTGEQTFSGKQTFASEQIFTGSRNLSGPTTISDETVTTSVITDATIQSAHINQTDISGAYIVDETVGSSKILAANISGLTVTSDVKIGNNLEVTNHVSAASLDILKEINTSGLVSEHSTSLNGVTNINGEFEVKGNSKFTEGTQELSNAIITNSVTTSGVITRAWVNEANIENINNTVHANIADEDVTTSRIQTLNVTTATINNLTIEEGQLENNGNFTVNVPLKANNGIITNTIQTSSGKDLIKEGNSIDVGSEEDNLHLYSSKLDDEDDDTATNKGYHIKATIGGEDVYLATTRDLFEINPSGLVDRVSNQEINGEKTFIRPIYAQSIYNKDLEKVRFLEPEVTPKMMDYHVITREPDPNLSVQNNKIKNEYPENKNKDISYDGISKQVNSYDILKKQYVIVKSDYSSLVDIHKQITVNDEYIEKTDNEKQTAIEKESEALLIYDNPDENNLGKKQLYEVAELNHKTLHNNLYNEVDGLYKQIEILKEDIENYEAEIASKFTGPINQAETKLGNELNPQGDTLYNELKTMKDKISENNADINKLSISSSHTVTASVNLTNADSINSYNVAYGYIIDYLKNDLSDIGEYKLPEVLPTDIPGLASLRTIVIQSLIELLEKNNEKINGLKNDIDDINNSINKEGGLQDEIDNLESQIVDLKGQEQTYREETLDPAKVELSTKEAEAYIQVGVVSEAKSNKETARIDMEKAEGYYNNCVLIRENIESKLELASKKAQELNTNKIGLLNKLKFSHNVYINNYTEYKDKVWHKEIIPEIPMAISYTDSQITELIANYSNYIYIPNIPYKYNEFKTGFIPEFIINPELDRVVLVGNDYDELKLRSDKLENGDEHLLATIGSRNHLLSNAEDNIYKDFASPTQNKVVGQTAVKYDDATSGFEVTKFLLDVVSGYSGMGPEEHNNPVSGVTETTMFKLRSEGPFISLEKEAEGSFVITTHQDSSGFVQDVNLSEKVDENGISGFTLNVRRLQGEESGLVTEYPIYFSGYTYDNGNKDITINTEVTDSGIYFGAKLDNIYTSTNDSIEDVDRINYNLAEAKITEEYARAYKNLEFNQDNDRKIANALSVKAITTKVANDADAAIKKFERRLPQAPNLAGRFNLIADVRTTQNGNKLSSTYAWDAGSVLPAGTSDGAMPEAYWDDNEYLPDGEYGLKVIVTTLPADHPDYTDNSKYDPTASPVMERKTNKRFSYKWTKIR